MQRQEEIVMENSCYYCESEPQNDDSQGAIKGIEEKSLLVY